MTGPPSVGNLDGFYATTMLGPNDKKQRKPPTPPWQSVPPGAPPADEEPPALHIHPAPPALMPAYEEHWQLYMAPADRLIHDRMLARDPTGPATLRAAWDGKLRPPNARERSLPVYTPPARRSCFSRRPRDDGRAVQYFRDHMPAPVYLKFTSFSVRWTAFSQVGHIPGGACYELAILYMLYRQQGFGLPGFASHLSDPVTRRFVRLVRAQVSIMEVPVSSAPTCGIKRIMDMVVRRGLPGYPMFGPAEAPSYALLPIGAFRSDASIHPAHVMAYEACCLDSLIFKSGDLNALQRNDSLTLNLRGQRCTLPVPFGDIVANSLAADPYAPQIAARLFAHLRRDRTPLNPPGTRLALIAQAEVMLITSKYRRDFCGFVAPVSGHAISVSLDKSLATAIGPPSIIFDPNYGTFRGAYGPPFDSFSFEMTLQALFNLYSDNHTVAASPAPLRPIGFGSIKAYQLYRVQPVD